MVNKFKNVELIKELFQIGRNMMARELGEGGGEKFWGEIKRLSSHRGVVVKERDDIKY